MHSDQDLTAAPATPLVLTILSEGESYGYAILKQVRELSGGELEWADGMLYPLLHRLRRLGYVTADWRAASEGQRRRYYTITPAGRGARGARGRKGVTMLGHSSGIWGGLLLSGHNGVRRPSRPGLCPSPALAMAGNRMGAHR